MNKRYTSHTSKTLATVVMGSVLSLTLALTACAPPKQSSPQFNGDGKAIITVPTQPDSRQLFTTITANGTDFRQSLEATGQSGGTFYAATIGGGPKTFNSWVSKDSTSSSMATMMTSGLITNDAYTGQAIPDLAEKIDVSDDKLTYTVTLRQGLKWSDGKPLTADDVLFTWNEIYKEGLGNSSSRDNSMVDGKFPEVTQIDQQTIQFKTAKPFAPFMRRLGYAIGPKHILKPVIQKEEAAFNAFWGTQAAVEKPESFVSSGMWLLERYDSTLQRATFKRNPNYHMVDKNGDKLPYLDRYVVNFVNDTNNLALQFEQGKMDAYNVPGQYLTHVRQLKQPDFQLYNLGPSDMKTFLFFNLSQRQGENGKPVLDSKKSNWFRNKAFRQAVNHGINRQDIVANILKGVGEPAYTAESPASPFIHPELSKGYPQDVDKAKKLLTDAGFAYDENGKLFDPQGNQVEFELLTNSGNEQRENIGVSIKEDLANLGMTVNFKPIEFNVLIGQYDTGTWESSIIGLGGGSPLEPHDGANVWRSDGALHMFNQRQPDPKTGEYDLTNRFDWETEIDELLEAGARTFDFEERKAIYHRLQEVVYEQQPFIYLMSPLQLVAVRSRLQNIMPTPLGGVTHNLESIWISKD